MRVLDGRATRARRIGAASQLRLSRPVAAAPGDRFVVRRLSPVETIGGGVVLDPLGPRARGRGGPEIRGELDRLESGRLSGASRALGRAGPRGRAPARRTLAPRAGVTPEEVRAALADPLARGRVHALRRSPERYVGGDAPRASGGRARGARSAGTSRGERRGGSSAAGLCSQRLLPARRSALGRGGGERRSSRAALIASPARRRGSRDAKSWRAPSASSPSAIAGVFRGARPRSAFARGGGAGGPATGRRSSRG